MIGQGPAATERDVTEAIVAVLDEGGVEFVFGIPGGYTGPLFVALHAHPRIRVVQVREESLGSTMAEAYGRLTGKPAVVMGQGEWIAGNAGQGLLEALLGCAPVLVLTEMSDGGRLSHHGPYQSGTGDYGAWDAVSALQGVSKRVMVSHVPAQAVQHTQLALKHALTGEPGPVTVIFRGKALQGTVGPESRPRLYPTTAYLPRGRTPAASGAVDAAALAIAESVRPVIIAGNGVRVGQATRALRAFAEAIDCPVATTQGGKGVYPEVDERAAGVIGTFGNATANTLVAEADLVVAIGTKLGPIDTADENPALLDPAVQTMVQIDVEPLNAAWTYPVDHVLVGDAATVIDQLITALPKGKAHATAAERVELARRTAPPRADRPETADDGPGIPPRLLIELLQETFPEEGIITTDAGENRLFMMQWFKTMLPGGYLQPAAGGGMGYAIPAAMGAQLAHPDRPVLATCGDGGFAMSMHGLMTAVQEQLPIAVLVFNNQALGWVLHGMGDKAVAANFAAFDHAAIARAIGCEAVRAETVEDVREALKRIGTGDKPYVIDVPTSLATSFKDIVQPIASKRWQSGD